MRRSNVRGSYSLPERIVPRRGKVSEHAVSSARQESCDVFHDDDAGSKLANDSRELEPETASRAREASSSPTDRNVLAWKATAEDIDAGRVGSDTSHVVVSNGSRPVPGEHSATPLVLLTLPRRLDIETSIAQGALEPELKPADTAEQRSESDHAALLARPARQRITSGRERYARTIGSTSLSSRFARRPERVW